MREPLDILLYLALGLVSLLLQSWGARRPDEEESPTEPEVPAGPLRRPTQHHTAAHKERTAAAHQLEAPPLRPIPTMPPQARLGHQPSLPAGSQRKRMRHRYTGWKKAMIMQALLPTRA